MNLKKCDKQNEVHPDSSGSFDRSWHVRFENLGKMNVPPYQKAAYPSSCFFEQRDFFLRHLVEEFIEELNSEKTRQPSCLDIGCNIGFYTKILHDFQLNVQGVDYSESLITEAKIRYPNIDFYQGSAYALPFDDSSFDSAVALGLIQCVMDWEKVLREIHRILRPGGIALIETNRFFHLQIFEKLVRNAADLVKGKTKLWEFSKKLRPRLKSSFESAPPRKFKIKDIVAYLTNLGVKKITVHDPASLFTSGNFYFAVIFSKPGTEKNFGPSKKVRYCSACR